MDSVENLIAKARAETGLDDVGGDEFIEALNHLVDSTNNDSSLSEIGNAAVEAEIHRVLVNRLFFEEDLKRHPEILDEDVSDPIVILGMPRTGTTKLQRMMAADPDVQRLEFWRLLNFARFPGSDPNEEDPRVDVARQAVAMMHQVMPDWGAIHGTAADEVDEEVYLQLHTCKSVICCTGRPLPSYLKWLRTESLRGTYEYMKRQLQYLQWQDRGKRDRPWILKSPVHMATTDLLVEQFPNATLVFTHRDIHKATASICRLMECSWGMYLNEVDKAEIGQVACDTFLHDLNQHLGLREELSNQYDIYDLPYTRIKDNCLVEIREIYSRAGRELTAERESAMLEWENNHPQHAAGRVRYQLEDYGLTRDDIDRICANYISQFGEYCG